LFQWMTTKFIFLAITVTYDKHGLHFDWIEFLLLWIAWSLTFPLVYTRMKK
jgi:hypothetical protein